MHIYEYEIEVEHFDTEYNTLQSIEIHVLSTHICVIVIHAMRQLSLSISVDLLP